MNFTNPANDEILNKIKKLLRVDPERGASQTEVEQALVAAQRLAARHNINLAEVDAAEEINGAGEPIVGDEFRPERQGGGECKRKLPTTHKYISPILEKYFAVSVLVIEGSDSEWKMTKHLQIFGRKTNVAIAIYVYGYLHREFMDLWHDYKRRTDAPMSSRGSFFHGLRNGLYDKLEITKGQVEAEAQAQISSSTSVALILVGEQDKVKQAVTSEHPRLIYSKVNYDTRDYTALQEGAIAGKKIEIKTALR